MQFFFENWYLIGLFQVALGIVGGILIRRLYHFSRYGLPGQIVTADRLFKSGQLIEINQLVLLPAGLCAVVMYRDFWRIVRFQNLEGCVTNMAPDRWRSGVYVYEFERLARNHPSGFGITESIKMI